MGANARHGGALRAAAKGLVASRVVRGPEVHVRTAIEAVGIIWLPEPHETAALVKSSRSLVRPSNYLFCIRASDSHASACAPLRKMGAAKKVPKAAPDPKATLAKSKADAQGFKCVKCMQVCHRP